MVKRALLKDVPDDTIIGAGRISWFTGIHPADVIAACKHRCPDVRTNTNDSGMTADALCDWVAELLISYDTTPAVKDRIRGAKDYQTFECDSWVYFIHDVQCDLVKIGVASDIKLRFASLRTMNPHDLVLLTYLRGTRAHEQKLHVAFADLRVKGEWFRFDDRLRLLIDAIGSEHEESETDRVASNESAI